MSLYYILLMPNFAVSIKKNRRKTNRKDEYHFKVPPYNSWPHIRRGSRFSLLPLHRLRLRNLPHNFQAAE